MSFVSAAPTGNVVGNTITWTTAQLTSFAQRSVGAVFQVPADVGLIERNCRTLQAEYRAAGGGPDEQQHHVHAHDHGSYDPNAKEVVTSSDFSDELYLIDEDEWVDYTIQFQNTGNDTAFFVVITDTLPSTLDPLTFRLGARSHPCIVDMMGQGRVALRIPQHPVAGQQCQRTTQPWFREVPPYRPRLPILPGTTIENIANIFFDYNPAIITEPSMLVAEFSTSVLPNSYVTGLEVFPNPTNGSFTVRSSHSSIRSVQLLSADGRLIMQEQSAGGASIMIDATSLAPGTYIVVTTSGTGARSRTRLTKN
ncbi:MAG: T9SS type A sorting domain-containing protein [Flavobacteriales bacterium]|nr:T9SS type A sorting domain-containing protein [Flavobacteriales bacterium]